MKLSIFVTRYNEPDDLVLKNLESLSLQNETLLEVLFLDQINSEYLKNKCKNYNNKNINFNYINIPARSLNFARNEAIRLSKSNCLAFCDNDAVVSSNWAQEIIKIFMNTQASVVGTKIIPRWEIKSKWYHKSKYIQEFYSLLDLGNEIIEVDKIIGASFAINKDKIKNIRFIESLDRRNGLLIGGGETFFCEQVKKAGGKVIYTPLTFVTHLINEDRMSIFWLFKRAYYGGISRSLSGGKIKPFNKKKSLIDFFALTFISMPYLVGLIRGKFFKK